MSYPGHSLGESYPSEEIQSVYSVAPSGIRTGTVVVFLLFINDLPKKWNYLLMMLNFLLDY